MTGDDRHPVTSDIDQFLKTVSATPPKGQVAGDSGRLIFALDATASRETTWDQACALQAEMFDATAGIGQLQIQLAWYRGYKEFEASQWCDDSRMLAREMTTVRCRGGHTQIGRVLAHVEAETRRQRVSAAVFVGDAVEESADDLCHAAGRLGVLGVPLFVFQEGHEPAVRHTFQQLAQLSGGAFAPFDAGSAAQLRELLTAVAVFASGGRRALEQHAGSGGKALARLTRQLPRLPR